MLPRRGFLARLAAGATLVLVAAPSRAVTAASAEPAAPIVLTRFDSAASFELGKHQATSISGRDLTLEPGATKGTWTSADIDPGIAFTQLVSSWNASTPTSSWLKVEVQAITADGRATQWYALGTWSEYDDAITRTSVKGQSDAVARVDTDTLVATGEPLDRYRLRVTLSRSVLDDPAPTVRMLGAVVSTGGAQFSGEASLPGSTPVAELPVPAYSQEIHAGHYPQWGSGGQRWCSPTSTSMVVASWGKGPSADDLAWVAPAYADPEVENAARGTYDAAFGGTGNWSFNVAYAGRFGLDAFVTQLRSLTEVEAFVGAAIPVVTSLKPGVYGMQGYLFPGSVEGHLLVVLGFDGAGNPIVNDPAAWSDAGVRKVYDRAQFERSWLGGSGGIAYIIRPPDKKLPPNAFGATRNW